MGDSDKVQWGKVLFGCGVAVALIAALQMAYMAGRRGNSRPPMQPVATAAAALTPTPALAPAPMQPPPEDVRCDAHLAPGAMLRDRGTGAQIAGRAIRLLEIFNGLPQDSIHVLGWAAEDSEAGPPCYATFAWEVQGVRHTARFKFWPRSPARLATANDEASEVADSVELLGFNGIATTHVQLTVASLLRLAGGFNNEDVYMSPRNEGEMLVRRQHCVPENVGLSTPEARSLVRMMRHAHITRYRCVSDNPWVTDIPRRGRIAPPYLAEAGTP